MSSRLCVLTGHRLGTWVCVVCVVARIVMEINAATGTALVFEIFEIEWLDVICIEDSKRIPRPRLMYALELQREPKHQI